MTVETKERAPLWRLLARVCTSSFLKAARHSKLTEELGCLHIRSAPRRGLRLPDAIWKTPETMTRSMSWVGVAGRLGGPWGHYMGPRPPLLS